MRLFEALKMGFLRVTPTRRPSISASIDIICDPARAVHAQANARVHAHDVIA